MLGLSPDELREFLTSLGELPYRSQQLYDAIYRRRVTSFEAMTELPEPCGGF